MPTLDVRIWHGSPKGIALHGVLEEPTNYCCRETTRLADTGHQPNSLRGALIALRKYLAFVLSSPCSCPQPVRRQANSHSCICPGMILQPRPPESQSAHNVA